VDLDAALAAEEAAARADEAAGKQPQSAPAATPDPVARAQAQIAESDQAIRRLTAKRTALTETRAAAAQKSAAAEAALQRAKTRLEARTKSTRDTAVLEKAQAEVTAAEEAYESAKADVLDLNEKVRAAETEIGKVRQRRAAAELDLKPGNRAQLPCFAGDTPVWTVDGPRRIDSLRPGDRIIAYDVEHATPVERAVREVVPSRTLHFHTLTVAGQRIEVTGRHRFWLPAEGRWRPARDLAVGARLHGMDGADVTVDAIDRHDRAPTVSWNLVIDATPDYFVGPGVLAHNGGGIDMGLGGRVVIYRATNPKYPGKVYIGQTVDVSVRWRSHRGNAAKMLADRGSLTAKDIEFAEFMSGIEPLETVVSGLNGDQADYVEQHNIDLERQAGPDRVMNRKEQIRSAKHRAEVIDRIVKDPAVQAAGYCRS
jgi:hypothetical protein